jgi:hypothetical protein
MRKQGSGKLVGEFADHSYEKAIRNSHLTAVKLDVVAVMPGREL